MAISPRWVGSPVSTPKENGPPPVGRQRHYGAVELAGAGGQVNVNDVVEIADAVKIETGGSEQHLQSNRPRLAQVLCMWEDTFTGAFRFRARCLVHVSDLPKDAVARLFQARRAFPDESPASSGGTHQGSQGNDGQSTPIKGGKGTDVDEVLLTADREDFDVIRIVKPVTLSVGTAAAESPAGVRKERGPRLTHCFEASSGEFVPVECTDAIAKRARVRRAEAAARESRLAEEIAAGTNGKPLIQSSGWLLPLQMTTSEAVAGIAHLERSSTATTSSVGDSESKGTIHGSSGPTAKALKLDGIEWEKDEGDSHGDSDVDSGSNSDATNTTCQQLGNSGQLPPPVRTSSRLRKSRGEEDNQGIKHLPAGPRQSPFSSSSLLLTPVVTPPTGDVPLVPRDTVVEHQEPELKRPRRLAMPAMKEEPRAVAAVATRQSKRRLSIAGETKRVRPSRAIIEGAEHCDSPPPRILVGDDYQADIPNLLSAKDRKEASVPPASGIGAKMVWRSIRKWDSQSRGMLSAYFDAAKEVVQKKQARSGVAVHVRLGGGSNCSDEAKHLGESGAGRSSVAGSYAVWAVTNGSSPRGAIRVACSEMAQTDIPASAIQRVQSEEEALAALVKARCTLDAFEPALKVLDKEIPESIEPWTLSQVRNLEQALEKDFDPGRRLHGWARKGMSMDRDDFINLAHVSEQVPDKTPAQVLSFYYRYLAAAEPLTDVVYGTEAAKARKLEAILPACGTGVPSRASQAKLSPAARLERAGWRTINPASRDGKVVMRDCPAKPSELETLAVSPQPTAPMTKRPRSASREIRPAPHALPPPKRYTLPLAPVAAVSGSSRDSAVAIDLEPLPANSNARSESKSRRAITKGQHVLGNVPVDVDTVQVNGLGEGVGEGARANGAVRRSTVTGASRFAAPQVSHPSSDARALHARPRLVATNDTAHATYGYRTDAAVSGRIERSPQRHPVSHNLARVSSEQVGDDGRNRRHIVDRGGVDGGYLRHGAREDCRSEGGRQEEDDLGFMAPCWRLLETAKNYLDPDQLLYMRGLIITHVQKPMTRRQLLERADSCLQDQQEVLAGFAKMFDRVDHDRAEAQLVPLYQVVKRARAVQGNSVSMMSQRERLSRSVAVGTGTRVNAAYSSYSRASAAHRTYEARPLGRESGVGYNDRDDLFSRATSESYSRVAKSTVDAREQKPMITNRRNGWWREGDSAAPAPCVRGSIGPLPSPYAPAPPTKSTMMFRDDRRDREFDVQGEIMRAWPEHQHQHQHQHQPTLGHWQSGDSTSFSAAAVPADDRGRVHWESGR